MIPSFLLAVVLALADGSVAISAGRTPDGAGLFEFDVTETLAGDIFVDGCAPLEVEMFVADRWVPEPVSVCTSTPAGQKIGEASKVFAKLSTSGRARVVLVWGTGCAVGAPFLQAGCTRLGSVTSPEFQVVIAPPPP